MLGFRFLTRNFYRSNIAGTQRGVTFFLWPKYSLDTRFLKFIPGVETPLVAAATATPLPFRSSSLLSILSACCCSVGERRNTKLHKLVHGLLSGPDELGRIWTLDNFAWSHRGSCSFVFFKSDCGNSKF
jgi:hypothetical protein